MNEDRSITREEIYDLVWAKPLTALAIELGVSNVGLAKICDRLGVPRPRSGHWLRPDRRKASRPSLPPPKEGTPIEIAIKPQPRRTTDVELKIPVAKRLTLPHPITAKIVTALENGSVNYDGQLLADGMRGCPVRVSKDLKSRALRILDAVIKAVEGRGLSVRLEKGYDRWSLSATSGQDKVAFHIREKLGQRRREPTKEESASGGYYSYPRVEQFAKGELLLEVEGLHRSNLQLRWADTKRQQLEEKVGGVVLAIEAAVDAERRNREHWEARRRELEAERHRIEEEERRFELERKRIERLQGMVVAWRSAATIRSFVR